MRRMLGVGIEGRKRNIVSGRNVLEVQMKMTGGLRGRGAGETK